jgi:hypothetical protein
MAIPAKRAHSYLLSWCGRGASVALFLSLSLSAHAATPEIRTSAQNVVPSCVTPQHLMSFLKSHNPKIEARFQDIARLYKSHGEAWRVRWDYSFFQMVVETNFLSFRNSDGSWADVNPRQNNFAGLGTTGGGAPGDSYPDVNTGVLAQIQHLVVYSGEHIANPIGPRTKLKQDDIVESIARLKRRATFADLSRRWAKDKHYGAAIEWVAGSYRSAYCNGPAAEAEAAATTDVIVADAVAPAAGLGGPASPENAAKTPPVRTIWSRSTRTDEPAKRAKTVHGKAKVVLPQEKPVAVAVPVPAPAKAQPAAPPIPEPQQQSVSDSKTIAVSAVAEAPVPQPITTVQPKSAAQDGPPAFAFAGAMNVDALTAIPIPQAIAGSARCRVLSASYGGRKTLLVRARAGSELHYTALTVLDGFERSMLDNFLKAHAPGGSSVGQFETRDAALARAKELCPGAAEAPRAERASAG